MADPGSILRCPRWRFRLTRSDGQEDMLYIPSSSSFTTSQTINLGDLGRSSLF